MLNRVFALLIFLAFLAFWQIASMNEWVSPVLLPSPLEISKYLYHATLDATILGALYTTLLRLVIGYCIGCVIGLALGLSLSCSELARYTLGVLAMGLQTLPSVCWAPLAILWFGQTESAMYFVIAMGSLWAIAIATENGIRSVSPIYIKAARVMGANSWHTWRTVILPASLPHLVSGAKLGWAFAWRSLMAAEIYITIMTHFGLGQLLHFGRQLHATDQAMGIMVLIIVIGFLADKLVFMPVEKYLRKSRGIA